MFVWVDFFFFFPLSSSDLPLEEHVQVAVVPLQNKTQQADPNQTHGLGSNLAMQWSIAESPSRAQPGAAAPQLASGPKSLRIDVACKQCWGLLYSTTVAKVS